MSSSLIGPVPTDRNSEESQSRNRQASQASSPASLSHESSSYSGPAAYLETQRIGLRRRNVRRPEPESAPPAASPAAAPPPSVPIAQRLHQIGSASGYAGMAASAAEYIHANPVSEALASVPVLGAASSARTAVTKKAASDAAYLKGDLTGAARHGLGSAASGIKAASDAATVASGGLSAPVTVPVSAVASAVNTATSLPEYVQSARDTYRDRHQLVSQGIAAASTLPGTLSSAASSVVNRLSGTPAAEPTDAERQQAATQKAIALRPAKRYLGKLD